MVPKFSWSCSLPWLWWHRKWSVTHVNLLHTNILPWSYRSPSLNLLRTFFFLSFFLFKVSSPRWPKPALNLPSFFLSLSNRWDYRPETSVQTCYFFWIRNTCFLKVFLLSSWLCYYLFHSAEATVQRGWMWCWLQPPGPLLFPVLLTTICIYGSSQKLWHGPAAPFSSFSVT